MMFQIIGTPTSTGFGGVLFTPWDERSKNAHALQQELQEKWKQIAGGQICGVPAAAAAGRAGLRRCSS